MVVDELPKPNEAKDTGGLRVFPAPILTRTTGGLGVVGVF